MKNTRLNAVFAFTGVLVITCMFVNIVDFTGQKNVETKNVHVIAAFDG